MRQSRVTDSLMLAFIKKIMESLRTCDAPIVIITGPKQTYLTKRCTAT